MSRQYRVRPAALAGVSDPYAAYCLDEAVYAFGTYVEAELNESAKGAKNEKAAQRKRMMRIQSLLRDDEGPEASGKAPVQPAPTKFRDPASVLTGGTKK